MMVYLRRALIATLFAIIALPVHAKVKVLGWPGGAEEGALRAAVETYNARASVAEEDKVELLFFSRDGFFDKLAADLAAGTDAFDANLIATYSIGRYAPFMDTIELGDDAKVVFGDKVLSTMRFEGKQYGVPTDLSLHFMYYRTDLIDALLADAQARARYRQISKKHLGQALDPKPVDQWDWNDWAATALYFTKAVNSDSPTRYGAVLQMKNLLFNMMIFQSLPRAYGADWQDERGRVTVDSEPYRKGLKLYKLLYDAGVTPNDSLSYEYAEANAAYASGQVATMLQWNAAAGDLLDAEKSPNVAAKTATMAPPSGPKGRFTHVHGLGLGINKMAKNKKGAIAFLNWLATREAMKIYAVQGGAPGLSESAIGMIAEERPDLVPLGRFVSNYGYVMRGGASGSALSVYEAQAKEFTGYWAGTQSLDKSLANAETRMEELLK